MESQRRQGAGSGQSTEASAQPGGRSGAQPQTGGNRLEAMRRLRQRYAWLNRLSDEDLQFISMCVTGAELVPGETYFDISNPEQGAFVGQPGQLIPEDGCLVRKRDVPPSVWAHLTQNF